MADLWGNRWRKLPKSAACGWKTAYFGLPAGAAACSHLRVISRLLAIVAVVLLCSIFAGCSDKQKEARKAAMLELMRGNTADPDMAAAIAKGKATVGEFLEALQHPKPGQSDFLVRAIFPAEGGKQQILWVAQLTYDGKVLHGKADDNTAQKGSGIPRNGEVAVEPSAVADWMYRDNGKAAGGWMLRVLKKKFPEEWEQSPDFGRLDFKE